MRKECSTEAEFNDTFMYGLEIVNDFMDNTDNWAAITELAKRLLVEERLEGADVRSIVIKHCGDDIDYYSTARREEREQQAA
jgi:hypothetical protein